MTAPTSSITVFWRPGCGFCSALFRQLEANGVPHDRVNIWEDRQGAETVRAAARGNETVPTVTIGPVALVNPRLDDVLRAAATHAPHLVPNGWEPAEPSRFARWLVRTLDRSSPQ